MSSSISVRNKQHIGLVTLLAALFTACSPHALREAQVVIRQADSAWTAGQPYHDSVQLAQAYETLSSFPAQVLATCHPQLATDYAHACYHYGRLLRSHDDPVAAMQCFINASHSRTRDFHILGRVYSNMGSMCHQANAYDVSYEIYKRSADMFFSNGDTTLYYYSLYNMAYESASLGHLDTCRSIIEELIHFQEEDDQLMAHCYIAYAEAYIICQQYDSALLFAHQALSLQSTLLTPKMQLAQAYSFLGQKDSSVYYAKEVLVKTNDLFAINNALYILTNDDESKDITSVRQTAADRSDTQKILEINQGKLSQAVQLLEQDINRKPDLRWVYAIICTLIIVGLLLAAYIRKKGKHHQLLSQQIQELEGKTQETKEYMRDQIEEQCQRLADTTHIKEELCWYDYHKMCSVVNLHFYGFIDKLNSYSLSEKETRLCVLVLLQANTEQMVNLIPYAQSGLGKFKYTTARKLGIKTVDFRSFLINLVS